MCERNEGGEEMPFPSARARRGPVRVQRSGRGRAHARMRLSVFTRSRVVVRVRARADRTMSGLLADPGQPGSHDTGKTKTREDMAQEPGQIGSR